MKQYLQYIHKKKNSSLLSVLLGIFLLSGTLLQAATAESTQLFLVPENITVNETAYLVVRTSGKKPDIKKLPAIKNLRWLRNSVRTSSQVSIVNGKMSSTYENHIPFIVTKKGDYKIDAGTFLEKTNKTLSFTAHDPVVRSAAERSKEAGKTASSGDKEKKENISIDEAIFSDVTIPGKKKSYYVGEEIPLKVDLYILQGLNGRPLAYPQIQFGEKNSAVFRNFSKSNPENPNFARITRSQKKIGKRIYSCLSFHTRFTPIAPGEMRISSRLPALLLVPDDRNSARRDPGGFFDDDFFGSFFNRERRIERSLPAQTSISVIPQPPLPGKNTFFTGLTGNWKGEVTLSPPPYKTGELINLKIRFTGEGSLDFFKAPALKLENFRIYPPEVEKGDSFAEIRYILIPTEPMDGKEKNIYLPPLAVLDPAQSKYILTEFSRAIAVKKGTSLLPQKAENVVVEGKNLSGKSSGGELANEELLEREHADDVLYLKKDEGKVITLPLWKNLLGSTLFFISCGILFLLSCLFIALHRKIRANDPAYARRKEAALLRKKLLHILAKLSPEELPEESGNIARALAGLANLPPGADLKECAEKIKERDPLFASLLEKLTDCAWMPSAKDQLDEKFKKEFLKKFSRISFLIAAAIFVTAAVFTPGTLAAQEKTKKVASMSEAAKAYDNGNFAAAEAYYRKLIREGKYSGNILYNLGNTLYRQGKYPQALTSYEQALRLAPRDSDILENLNLVRRKLSLAEKGIVTSPADIFSILQDELRPDEWLLVSSVGFFLLCIGFGICFLAGSSSIYFRTFAITGAVILLCALCAFFSSLHTSYSGKSAIVIKENIRVYSLPSAKSETLSIKFHPGEALSIEEKRQDFFRVRSGNAEGWVKADDVQELQVNKK